MEVAVAVGISLASILFIKRTIDLYSIELVSAKLASGQNAKIGYEINLIEKSLDKMNLDMNGIELDNELKRRVMDSKVQEAEMTVKALMNSILVGNSQIKTKQSTRRSYYG